MTLMNDARLIDEIIELKKQKNAVILVHNYQKPEVYEISDYIGDSFGLCRAAMKTKAGIIVFCGVDFMAESARILNPEKKVLHPVREAVCPMAQMVTPNDIALLRKRHPDAAVVSYVNTTAGVKACSDICCTSANAVKVISSVREKDVIFVPDEHLARYVQKKTDKKIIPVNGFCYVHANISRDAVLNAKKLHPDAEVVAHPECVTDVTEMADAVCSTSQMLDYCRKSPAKEFIIATECGMVERLQREIPGKRFYPVGGVCIQMKKITLQSVRDSLVNEQHEVILPEKIMRSARKALERMMSVSG